jgi:trimethylamine--corrinoid protein Co-methyltransferase
VKKREAGLFGAVEILSEEEIERIHNASLQILEEVGALFEDPEAQEALRKSGARVDGEIVRFPAELVEESIGMAPEHVIFAARDKEKTLQLGSDRVLFTNGFGATEILDFETGEYRKATVGDLKNLTVLCDYLENIDYCLYQVFPQDISPQLSDVAQAFILLSYTGKNVHLSTQDANYIHEVIELGEIVSDRGSIEDPPVYSLGCCPFSPLKYPMDTTIRLREAVKRKIPSLIVSGAVSGASAPITPAGSLVVQNAEILAGIVLTQAVLPGAPVVYGSFTSPMDPMSGKQLLGMPELPLINSATAQLCRRYKIPFGYGTGGVADSFEMGVQTGFEKGLTTMLGALGGVEVIHDGGSGLLGSARVVSYEQLFLDNELCGMVKHFLKGIEVTDKTLALDTIRQVGPGGDFLLSDHTVENLREAIYFSSLWDRDRGSTPGEGDRVLRKARTRVSEILKTHRPTPLRPETIREIEAILRKVGLEKILSLI